MTQKFVTLPREVVENALDALNEADLLTDHRQDIELRRSALVALRAALEQPQNHVPDFGNMVQAGWKLVPVEPTGEMLRAMSSSKAVDNDGEFPSLSDLIGYSGDDKTLAVMKAAYAAMLAAAPEAPAQQPTIPQGYKLVPVDQTQGEMGALPEIVERVLRSAGKTRRETSNPCITANECIKLANWIVANTNPQPAQKPLTDDQVLKAVRHLYQSDFAAGMGFPGDLDVARTIEAAHNIK